MWGNLLLITTIASLWYYNDSPMLSPPMTVSNTPALTQQMEVTLPPQLQQHLSAWLNQQGVDLHPQVIAVLESILQYADTNQIEHSPVITLIDYSLPANQKRLWVFDLNTHQVLFHTYVSHGIKSGALNSNYFSNRYDSKASSIGVYRTDKPYYGRHGLSLKLNGLDRGFNDNAESRAIVMHGGWYVEDAFIDKYGRAGRSWGCPAVSDKLVASIINTIKDKSLLIIYYPHPEWFVKSKFIKVDSNTFFTSSAPLDAPMPEPAEDVLFAQLLKKNKYHETEAIMVTPIEHYKALFQQPAPLNRMLRRQIDNIEYIALSTTEFNQILALSQQTSGILDPFQDIYFVVPEIKMVRGYYATEMNKIDLGKIKTVRHEANAAASSDRYIINFDNQSSIQIKSTHRFIRWLGL